tara:strand:+ start:44895 stop:45353 length:459 start_codon:yes stop_codon:yes gene_type:complete
MDKDFEKKIIDIYNNLNNGLSWDKIEKTKYEEIEKKREQNASVSDFSKLIFKIRNNNELLEISNNIEELYKNRERILMGIETIRKYEEPKQYECNCQCHVLSPFTPYRETKVIYNKLNIYKYIKDTSIDVVPFLKNNIIHKEIGPQELKYYD